MSTELIYICFEDTNVRCYIQLDTTHNSREHNILFNTKLIVQHCYIALRGTYTICYIEHYITCYVVDRYYNITLHITKEIWYITMMIT